jgi:nucleoside diphosphate kinase
VAFFIFCGIIDKGVLMDYTIAVLKPNVIENRQVGEILRLIDFWGFTIDDMKYIKSADIDFVKEFYSIHKDKDFYDRLTNGMYNRPWLAIKLGHKSAGDVVGWWRKWLKEIRKEYSGEELHDNAVHGSDSDESAIKESNLIFGSCIL